MVLPIRYSLLRIMWLLLLASAEQFRLQRHSVREESIARNNFSSSLTLLRTGVQGQLLSAARFLTLSVNTLCQPDNEKECNLPY